MIEIRTMFKDWHEVDRETAKLYVRELLHMITAIPSEEVIPYIEHNKLKGITVKELLDE